MENFKKQFRNKALIILGLFLVSGVILYFSASYIAKLSKDISNQRFLVYENSNINGVLADLKNGNDSAAAYIKGIGALVPAKDQLISDLSRVLSNQGTNYGVGVTFDFQQGVEVKPTPTSFGHAGFSLSVTGPLSNLIAFLRYLETASPRFLMSFESADIAKTSNDYVLNAKGLVYFKE
ncbi:MAG: hypothetical protein WCX12_03170 [Candidatus Paceibacterota bacterium]|jgi:hypothetical protein